MKAFDLAELAARNLREAVLRNSLTTLGIAVGVASLVAMLSLGIGLQELAGRRLERTGLFDTVLVRPKQQFAGLGRRGRLARDPELSSEPSRRLDDAAREEIARLPHVVEVYPEIRFTADVRYAGAGHVTFVASVPLSARSRGTFDALQGSFFSSPGADEAILQIELARELAEETKTQPAALIGRQIALRYPRRKPAPAESNRRNQSSTASGEAFSFGLSIVPAEATLRIVGIVENEEAGAGAAGFGRSRVFIPLELAQRLDTVQGSDVREVMGSSGLPAYSNLSVRVSGPSQVQAVEDAVKRMGFAAFSLLDVTRNLRRFFAVLDLFLGIFGSLALAVASLGIINTLVMAILERRREIGILKALGAANRDVRQLFFAEAGVMGLLGGALGAALGWAIGRVINFGANVYLQRQDLPAETIWSVPWWLVLAAIVFSILVSLLAGIYPASRAARLDPVEALRYE